MISAGNQAVHSYKTPRRLFYSLAAWSINDERALMSSKILDWSSLEQIGDLVVLR